MKKLITISFFLFHFTAPAQWSNTTNQFVDSLHMFVSTAAQIQNNPLVLKSYPDGGYFVIWEDLRNVATSSTDIYAQKYDRDGNRLWAENGVPVANGTNAQRYVFSSTQDYRNRSFAATDSAGGFYLGYIDDSLNNYSWERMAVQHMLPNGNQVFPGAGFIVAATPAGQSFTYSMPLLIPDGNKGFYMSYSINTPGQNNIDVYDYRDENGTLKLYGSGRMTNNAIQRSQNNLCGVQYYLDYPLISILDYNIWPDGQGGCNVIMAMNGNGAGQGRMLGFNRLWRAKKDSRVQTYFRNTTGNACPRIDSFIKGNVYPLYQLKMNTIVTTCSNLFGTEIYVVTSTYLTSNGFRLVDLGGYDYNFPKGITMLTSRNINVDLIGVTRRTITNNTVSNFTVQAYAYPIEKFDSVPSERTSYNNPNIGFNPVPRDSLAQLNFFRDTVLGTNTYYADFSLAGANGEIYAAALMTGTPDRLVKLQHLSLSQVSADSLALTYHNTPKTGAIIGKEISTGFSGNNISYDFPLVSVNKNGNALFYIREYYRGARVSPIYNDVELIWGAMGAPISTGVYNNYYYNLEQPVALVDPAGGTGIIAWRDNKTLPNNSNDNIFMRHLDSLDVYNYKPPVKPIRIIPNPYGASPSNPIVISGSSKHFSPIEVYGLQGSNAFTTTVAEIMDTYNLGVLQLNLFQNSGALRSYNGQPYLDRNYTIKTENTPAGANINLRLYFTNQEFNALKAADNSISTPADLIVIKQPNPTTTTPLVYTPIAGEEVKSPVAWGAVPGGYFIEIEVSGFSNFFIQKSASVALCPGGNTAVSSNLTGSSYQWQVNIGSGFSNMVNNANYTGVTTVNLQLTGVPSAWYGYQYRCVVDGNTGNVFSLKFVNTFTGTAGSAWENPANWSCGSLPDTNTDVVISAGPITVNSNVAVRSLRINPGVNIAVKAGFNLEVKK